MLRIDDLTYRVGPRVLLDQATAAINLGHKVGLVGANGTGKTTLLRMITGALSPDGGTIHTPPGWRIGVTAQEAPGGPQSLIATVLDADRELAGLTRKRKGKLYLTKRGQAVVEGRLPSGELFGMLLQQYATRYNWAYEDAMPASQ